MIDLQTACSQYVFLDMWMSIVEDDEHSKWGASIAQLFDSMGQKYPVVS